MGLANFFAEQQKWWWEVKELEYDLPDSHFMALATHVFDNCGHTGALILEIHLYWKKKRSTDYKVFQMHYNKKLRELYGLEEKVVKESAQDTKLKQELVDLKEKLAKITTLEAKLD